MTNQRYPTASEGFLGGEISWDVAGVAAVLVRGYTYNSTHRFVSHVTGAGGILSTPATLAARTKTLGVADAADTTFPLLPVGPAYPALIIYQATAPTGGPALPANQQRLIAFIDDAIGLPVTPNGADAVVIWDNGVNRIFRI